MARLPHAKSPWWRKPRPGLLPSLLACVLVACTSSAPEATLVFENVRLFDGADVHERTTVVVRNGVVSQVSPDAVLPPDAEVVDGNGRTLLPGLIDAHVHTDNMRALQRSLIFGVSTELGMGETPATVAPIKEKQGPLGARDRADLFSAGYIVTPPGGHGAFPGTPTLGSGENVDAFIRDRIDEGSDYIKLVYMTGSSELQYRQQGRVADFEPEVMEAVIDAAHRHGKLALAHVNNLAAAKELASAGIDGLAHVFYDAPADDELVELLLRNGVFVVPTLTAHETIFGNSRWGPDLADDAEVSPYLGPDEVAFLRRQRREGAPDAWMNMLESTGILHRRGVPILAGTDVPELHGLSLHRELESLVLAGLAPVEALASATAVVAEAFDLPGKGRVIPGAPADLVLVRGDPTSHITATRSIVGVWKAGVPVDRQAYRTSKEALRSAAEGPRPLLLHDFESEDATPRFGSMIIQTDLHGPWPPPPSGGSTATWEQVGDGADGSERSLRVTGEIVPGHESVVNHPRWSGEYAGIAFGPIAPMFRGITLDFSSKNEITFWAKGANRAYRLILFQRFFGPPAGEVPFTAGPQWSQFSIPLSDFTNLDPSSIRWIVFSGPSEPGAFSFLVDQIVVR